MSTSELQNATSFTGIYSHWRDEIGTWHIGTQGMYPVLNIDFNNDGTATWQEFGRQKVLSPPMNLELEAGTSLSMSWDPPANIEMVTDNVSYEYRYSMNSGESWPGGWIRTQDDDSHNHGPVGLSQFIIVDVRAVSDQAISLSTRKSISTF